MLASTTILIGAGLGAEPFLLRGSEPALGSTWPFAGMTGPKFGRVNEMKKVTPRRSRRLRPSPSEADSMELVVVMGMEFKESISISHTPTQLPSHCGGVFARMPGPNLLISWREGLASHCALRSCCYSMTVILPQIERSDSSGRWDYAVISWRQSYHRAEYLYVDSSIRTTCSLSTSSSTNTSDSPRASNFATTAQFRIAIISSR
ncbi:uncharacterized protein ARMOST_22258 [Armillaria ostoyae]|uniref:Uncharacterized protein n=1 Tax=Armillaria ostoyae TaxID=47428 RepID=A0A284SCC9_ARMOS|nr:uncharacterized protein ARMOST_22258 [Armillaria ostoyae]